MKNETRIRKRWFNNDDARERESERNSVFALITTWSDNNDKLIFVFSSIRVKTHSNSRINHSTFCIIRIQSESKQGSYMISARDDLFFFLLLEKDESESSI